MTTQLKLGSCIFPGLDPGYQGGKAGIKAMAPAPSYYYFLLLRKTLESGMGQEVWANYLSKQGSWQTIFS